MELILGLDSEIPKNSVLTVGSFDGIHLGHKRIISFMRRLAKQINGTNCLITFEPHPRKLLYHDGLVHSLASTHEKTKLLAALGLDRMYILSFTKELASMTAEDFFQKIIYEHFKPVHFFMGYDHAFGKGRKGDFSFMKSKSLRHGFGLTRVGPKVIGGKPVSSSRIRYALRVGELDIAHKLLGRYYSFRGIVVEGMARGKKIGFPTANIKIDDEDKILPPDGVYEIMVYLPKMDSLYRGLLNIGNNPTFENKHKSVEAHILDFDRSHRSHRSHREIYGEIIECTFISHIRGEIKFSSISRLIEQIKKDVELVQKKTGPQYSPIKDELLPVAINGNEWK